MPGESDLGRPRHEVMPVLQKLPDFRMAVRLPRHTDKAGWMLPRADLKRPVAER